MKGMDDYVLQTPPLSLARKPATGKRKTRPTAEELNREATH